MLNRKECIMSVYKKFLFLFLAAFAMSFSACLVSHEAVQANNAAPQLVLVEHHLDAKDSGDIYQVITDAGFGYETPDDERWGNHPGVRHIDRVFDQTLNKNVFALNIHYDDKVKDTWVNSGVRGGPVNDLQNSQQVDRQRNELKTDNTSPAWGKARRGSEATYRWKFKLPAGFVASAQFTHIHQLKAVGGDDSSPIITLSVRKRTGFTQQEMQLVYRYASDSAVDHNRYLVEKILLEDFLDEWVSVEEKVFFDDENPAYEFTAVRVSDGKTLMHYKYDKDSWTEDVPFRTFRRGNNFVRPKWGIYRQLLRNDNGNWVEVSGPLRDETVLFADIGIETLTAR